MIKLLKVYQLLVAPAALGLLAPVAANATDFNATDFNATELNINGVSDYAASSASNSREQVTSITQFSDVVPTDWAYQALSNLIERYGCVAGYPNGTYRGNRAMTRFEAAALLNACLDRVTEVTDELKRLMKEFEKELAILRGRVDGLEARVSELEATQFSTTTKLKGQATFVIGANSFGGDAKQGLADALRITGSTNPIQGFEDKRSTAAASQSGAASFNYDLKLKIDTSFTGKDLLRTILRAGNFNQSAFSGKGYVGLDALDVAFEERSGINSVGVNRLWYKFPIHDNLVATVGGRVRSKDMLMVWPSVYPEGTILDFFKYAGSPQSYNLVLGSGVGLGWINNNLSLSANYVSGNGGNSRPDVGNANAFIRDSGQCGGIATDCAGSSSTVQIAYARQSWGTAAAYTYASGNNGAGLYPGNATPMANLLNKLGATHSVALSGWFMPADSRFIPSISAGWGYNIININNADFSGLLGLRGVIQSAVSQSWSINLHWPNAFIPGNVFGVALGQPTFVTSWENNSTLNDGNDFVADGNYAWELWYTYQITDHLSVTPGFYYLSRPLGFATNNFQASSVETFSNAGFLVQTVFRF